MKNLRQTLKLSVVQFAQIIGMDSSRLSSYELTRSPWKPADISNALSRLEKHLETSLQAVRDLKPKS